MLSAPPFLPHLSPWSLYPLSLSFLTLCAFLILPLEIVVLIATVGIQALSFTSYVNISKLLNYSVSMVPLCKIKSVVGIDVNY